MRKENGMGKNITWLAKQIEVEEEEDSVQDGL